MPADGRKTPEERLDAATDLAVREMLDVEPRADLRARVIDEIERRRHPFNWTWVMAPVAAAAIVVLAALLSRPGEISEPPRRSNDIVLRASQPTGQTASMITSPAPLGRVGRRVNAQRREVTTVFVASEPARPAIQLEPLRQIDAISVAPVTLQALDTERIGIAPLTPIVEIELEPVNPSGGQN